jgi:hypothetical protein
METELRLKGVKEAFQSCVSKVNDYYINVLRAKTREDGPREILLIIERIHNNWESWIQEFFCDLFALYTLGPAYAWSHLHLTTKKSKDIHQLSVPLEQSHPSDESRMRMLIEGLKITNFGGEAEAIRKKWDAVTGFWAQPSSYYQYAYPNELLREIAILALDGLQKSGFLIASNKILKDAGRAMEVRSILNEAWQRFWNSPYEEFRVWEESRIQNLRNGITEKVTTSHADLEN